MFSSEEKRKENQELIEQRIWREEETREKINDREKTKKYIQDRIEAKSRIEKEKWWEIARRDAIETEWIRTQLDENKKEINEKVKKMEELGENASLDDTEIFNSLMDLNQTDFQVPLKQSFETIIELYDRSVRELRELKEKIEALELEYEETTVLCRKNDVETEVTRLKTDHYRLFQVKTKIETQLCYANEQWKKSEIKQQLNFFLYQNQQLINENKELKSKFDVMDFDLMEDRLDGISYKIREARCELSRCDHFLKRLHEKVGWYVRSAFERYITINEEIDDLLLIVKYWMESVVVDLEREMKRIAQCKLIDESSVKELYDLHRLLNDIRTMNETISKQKIVDSEVERCNELLRKVFISDSEEKEKKEEKLEKYI